MKKEKKNLSKISRMDFIKLFFRSLLFVVVFFLYIYNRTRGVEGFLEFLNRQPLVVFLVWLVFVIEMFLRFFPSKMESLDAKSSFISFLESGRNIHNLSFNREREQDPLPCFGFFLMESLRSFF